MIESDGRVRRSAVFFSSLLKPDQYAIKFAEYSFFDTRLSPTVTSRLSRTGPMPGFKRLDNAVTTTAGIELMPRIRNGQLDPGL